MSLALIERPSPNHDERPEGAAVDLLILHYTGMASGPAALARLCDPAAKVSAHYCIEEDGRVFRLVPEDRRAWHAGVASWGGATDINGRSIGIELVNPGHEFGYRPFPEPQMAALVALARGIVARHGIAPQRVLGHSDVAPERKEDPGELFDWPRLAQAGIGLWPAPAGVPKGATEGATEGPVAIDEVQAQLRRFGYGIEVSGRLDRQTGAVIRAFQRHFRPDAVSGEPDPATAGRLRALLALLDRPAVRP